jgi:ABC-type multidrug transport system, ATPase component
MANEFSGLKLDCVSPDYIPYGNGYSNSVSQYRGCSVLGSNNGIIDGETYIHEQYHYSRYHIWRGFGIIIGFWAFFLFLTSLGFELNDTQGGSSILLYKRGSEKKKVDEEMSAEKQAEVKSKALSQSAKQSTFTWKDLDYYVQYQGAQKQLLNKVFGFVKPGNLVALMGSSGAGKTTYVSEYK